MREHFANILSLVRKEVLRFTYQKKTELVAIKKLESCFDLDRKGIKDIGRGKKMLPDTRRGGSCVVAPAATSVRPYV